MPDVEALLRLVETKRARGEAEEALELAALCRESAGAHASAHACFAACLVDLQRWEDAEAAYRHALSIAPQMAEAANNLGHLLLGQGRVAECLAPLRHAMALQPEEPMVLRNLGHALKLLGRVADARRLTDRAVELAPELAVARMQRGLLSLTQAEADPGWSDFAYRRHCEPSARPLDLPMWNGSDLSGRLLVVYCEQGFGDTLNFARYLPMLRALRDSQGESTAAERVWLLCPSRLVAFLSAQPQLLLDGVSSVAAELPTADMMVSLFDLPRILREDLTAPYAPSAYLYAAHQRVYQWTPPLSALEGLRVGLCWQGASGNWEDRFRSVPLSAFEPLCWIPGVQLVSLQHGEGVEQIEQVGGRVPLAVFDDVDLDGAFVDTAAIIAQLDLVITVDSAVAHLAGALGAEVWLLLFTGPDWRWGAAGPGTDGPTGWYPRTRQMRQSALGNWSELVDRVGVALRQRVAGGVAPVALPRASAPLQEPWLRVGERARVCADGKLQWVDQSGQRPDGSSEIAAALWQAAAEEGVARRSVNIIGPDVSVLARRVAEQGPRHLVLCTPSGHRLQRLCADLLMAGHRQVELRPGAFGADASVRSADALAPDRLDAFEPKRCDLLLLCDAASVSRLLLGASETITRCRPTVLFAAPDAGLSAPALALLEGQGYALSTSGLIGAARVGRGALGARTNAAADRLA